MSFASWQPVLVALLSLVLVIAGGFLVARFIVTGLLGRVILTVSALGLYFYLLLWVQGFPFVSHPVLFGVRAGCMGLAFGLAYSIVRRRPAQA